MSNILRFYCLVISVLSSSFVTCMMLFIRLKFLGDELFLQLGTLLIEKRINHICHSLFSFYYECFWRKGGGNAEAQFLMVKICCLVMYMKKCFWISVCIQAQ